MAAWPGEEHPQYVIGPPPVAFTHNRDQAFPGTIGLLEQTRTQSVAAEPAETPGRFTFTLSGLSPGGHRAAVVDGDGALQSEAVYVAVPGDGVASPVALNVRRGVDVLVRVTYHGRVLPCAVAFRGARVRRRGAPNPKGTSFTLVPPGTYRYGIESASGTLGRALELAGLTSLFFTIGVTKTRADTFAGYLTVDVGAEPVAVEYPLDEGIDDFAAWVEGAGKEFFSDVRENAFVNAGAADNWRRFVGLADSRMQMAAVELLQIHDWCLGDGPRSLAGVPPAFMTAAKKLDVRGMFAAITVDP